MFIRTADNDYIMTRVAFWAEADVNFLWNSAHCLEKYFKAILLYNGEKSQKYGHNIVKLYNSVKEIHPNLNMEYFPERINFIYDISITKISSFIERLYNIGQPDNRYMSIGYSNHTIDLIKIDFLVFYFRRFCQKRHHYLPGTGDVDIYDGFSDLDKYSKLYDSFPIENLITRKEPKFLYDSFRKMNFSFFEMKNNEDFELRANSRDSPLRECMKNTGSPYSIVREEAFIALEWAQKNLVLSPEDKTEIKKLLKDR